MSYSTVRGAALRGQHGSEHRPSCLRCGIDIPKERRRTTQMLCGDCRHIYHQTYTK